MPTEQVIFQVAIAECRLEWHEDPAEAAEAAEKSPQDLFYDASGRAMFSPPEGAPDFLSAVRQLMRFAQEESRSHDFAARGASREQFLDDTLKVALADNDAELVAALDDLFRPSVGMAAAELQGWCCFITKSCCDKVTAA